MSETTCPLCGQAAHAPRDVTVCGGCHQSLVASRLPVRTTGEYDIETLARAADASPEPGRPGPVTAPGHAFCTWCHKPKSEAKKLLSRGAAHICNECVALCVDILDAEFDGGWR